MDPVYVYMYEERDPESGTWTRSRRLATAAAIARIGARQVPGSARLVFAEMIGPDGFVAISYAG